MIRYTSASRSPRTPVLYDTFLSVDFAKAASNVKAYHSPDAVNMIRDEYGKVRRRMVCSTAAARDATQRTTNTTINIDTPPNNKIFILSQ